MAQRISIHGPADEAQYLRRWAQYVRGAAAESDRASEGMLYTAHRGRVIKEQTRERSRRAAAIAGELDELARRAETAPPPPR
jgi:hypothetical protein